MMSAFVDEFYSVQEFAALLGVSRDRVYEWCRRAQMEATRVTPHSQWLIPKTELERLKGVTERQQTIAPTDTARERHLADLARLLDEWARDLRRKADKRDELGGIVFPTSATPVYDDRLLPRLLQHCPEVDERYQSLREGSIRAFHAATTISHTRIGSPMQDLLYESYSELGEVFLSAIFLAFVNGLENPRHNSAERGFGEFAEVMKDKYDLTDWPTALHDAFLGHWSDAEFVAIRQLLSVAIKAEEDSSRAIEHCLVSHEYARHTCDWCP
jgi:excisionase family DNA binding protein